MRLYRSLLYKTKEHNKQFFLVLVEVGCRKTWYPCLPIHVHLYFIKITEGTVNI